MGPSEGFGVGPGFDVDDQRHAAASAVVAPAAVCPVDEVVAELFADGAGEQVAGGVGGVVGAAGLWGALHERGRRGHRALRTVCGRTRSARTCAVRTAR